MNQSFKQTPWVHTPLTTSMKLIEAYQNSYQPHIPSYLLKWVEITTKLCTLPSLCLPRESKQGGATFSDAFFLLLQPFLAHACTRLPFLIRWRMQPIATPLSLARDPHKVAPLSPMHLYFKGLERVERERKWLSWPRKGSPREVI